MSKSMDYRWCSSCCSNWGLDYRGGFNWRSSQGGETASSAEVITLKVAYIQTTLMTLSMKKNQMVIMVAVLKAVDEKLANYQFSIRVPVMMTS